MLHVVETGVPVVSLQPESSRAERRDCHSSPRSWMGADGVPAGSPGTPPGCGSLTPLLNTHRFGVPHATPPKPPFPCKIAVVAVNEMLLPYYSQDIALN